MNNKQLSEMVIRLFESKCKNYSQTTIKVWVDELKQFDLRLLPAAIKMAILSADDFPTIGKILENIEVEYSNQAVKLMDSKNDTAKMIAKKAGVNLDKFGSEFVGAAADRCIERFTEVFKKELKQKTININYKELL